MNLKGRETCKLVGNAFLPPQICTNIRSASVRVYARVCGPGKALAAVEARGVLGDAEEVVEFAACARVVADALAVGLDGGDEHLGGARALAVEHAGARSARVCRSTRG